MITGVDYILYTNKSQDAFTKKIKESIPFWNNPYIVIYNVDDTSDYFLSRYVLMFQLMDEKGFYIDKASGEGPFLLIFNSGYSLTVSRITLVLPGEIDESKFAKQVYDWIKSIL